jgi:hypothetical protein
MSARLLLQMNAIVGAASVLASAAMMWLLLTRPVQMASAAADYDLQALALAVAGQISAWVHALLRFL